MTELVPVIALGIAVLALVGVAWALLRVAKPPQQRTVSELTGRVEELEHDLTDLHGRFSKRARTESLEKARMAHEERSERRNSIEAQAASIIEAARAAPPPSTPPMDPDAERRALRARILGGGH